MGIRERAERTLKNAEAFLLQIRDYLGKNLGDLDRD